MDGHYNQIKDINTRKGHDYAGDNDALSNFKTQAAALGLTPQQVWGVFAGKHWSAITTFIKEGDVKSEPIEGRVHDVILYCFLLLGLIAEQKEPVKSKRVDPGRDIIKERKA
jgi:hypothetical protein